MGINDIEFNFTRSLEVDNINANTIETNNYNFSRSVRAVNKDQVKGVSKQTRKNKNNQRRIPTGKYLKMKKKSLLPYVYLQQISSWSQGDNHRYIETLTLNRAEMCRETGMSNKGIYNQLKHLEEVGLIKYWTKEHEWGATEYILLPEVNEFYVLVNFEEDYTKKLLGLQDELLLKMFLFHKSYSTMNGRSYMFTLDYLADGIGYSKSNLNKIVKANAKLEELGIIRQNKKWVRDGGTTKSFIEYAYLK